MAKFDFDGITKEVERVIKSSQGKKSVEKAIDDYVKQPDSLPIKAAQKFIDVLRSQIENRRGSDYEVGQLGDTAIAALFGLKYGKPKLIGDKTYKIDVWFTDDLSRSSLMPDRYNDITNIAALLNSGYRARKSVYGIWRGHGDEERYSLKVRKGSNFIDESIRIFRDGYASKYKIIDIDCDDIYK